MEEGVRFPNTAPTPRWGLAEELVAMPAAFLGIGFVGSEMPDPMVIARPRCHLRKKKSFP
jgi:hypothetical protein